jgi:hypothetical protein
MSGDLDFASGQPSWPDIEVQLRLCFDGGAGGGNIEAK